MTMLLEKLNKNDFRTDSLLFHRIVQEIYNLQEIERLQKKRKKDIEKELNTVIRYLKLKTFLQNKN